MAKVCNNLQELRSEIMKRVNIRLKEYVGEKVNEVMLEYIETDVYNAYEPKTYLRRGNNGGLSDPDNIVVQREYDGAISIENVTVGREFYFQDREPIRSNNADRPLTPIIETGKGYDYWSKAFPRPFVNNTVDEIVQEKIIENTLKEGLKKQGLEVK